MNRDRTCSIHLSKQKMVQKSKLIVAHIHFKKQNNCKRLILQSNFNYQRLNELMKSANRDNKSVILRIQI